MPCPSHLLLFYNFYVPPLDRCSLVEQNAIFRVVAVSFNCLTPPRKKDMYARTVKLTTSAYDPLFNTCHNESSSSNLSRDCCLSVYWTGHNLTVPDLDPMMGMQHCSYQFSDRLRSSQTDIMSWHCHVAAKLYLSADLALHSASVSEAFQRLHLRIGINGDFCFRDDDHKLKSYRIPENCQDISCRKPSSEVFFFFLFWIVRLLALRPLLTYCVSLVW
jgi:hypothetical protein